MEVGLGARTNPGQEGSGLPKENRKTTRVLSCLRCWCESEEITLYARVGNLSEGGLFLRTSTPLDTGRRARVRLGGGMVNEVLAEATVMWNRSRRQDKGPAGMGLRFEGLDSGAQDVLRRIISDEERRPPFGH
jgi:uncharacterized protein (TIGR02266 family)